MLWLVGFGGLYTLVLWFGWLACWICVLIAGLCRMISCSCAGARSVGRGLVATLVWLITVVAVVFGYSLRMVVSC